jgi:hypothetical protein
LRRKPDNQSTHIAAAAKQAAKARRNPAQGRFE